MTGTLSDWGRSFLQEARNAVISTLKKDGSPHVVPIWYLLTEDDAIIICAQTRTQKVKNLQRDPRIALCVESGASSVSLYGKVEIIEDQLLVRQHLKPLVEHYIPDEARRQSITMNLLQRDPVILRFIPEKVTEFSELLSSIL